MLVKLFGGLCIDPSNVKYISVRGEMVREEGQMKQVFHVGLKTDGDEMLKVGTFDVREEAEAQSEECAKRINKALGEGDEEDEDEDEAGGDATADDADPFADDADPFADDHNEVDPFADDDREVDPFANDDHEVDPFADD